MLSCTICKAFLVKILKWVAPRDYLESCSLHCLFTSRSFSQSSGKRSAMFCPCAHLHIKHGKHLVRKVSFNLLILIAVPNITECPLNKGKRVPNNRVAEIAALKYDVETNHHLVLISLTHHFSQPLLLLKKTVSITFGEMLAGSNKRILGFGVMHLASLSQTLLGR